MKVTITITADMDDSLTDEQAEFIGYTAEVQVIEPIDTDGETPLRWDLVKNVKSTVVIERQ